MVLSATVESKESEGLGPGDRVDVAGFDLYADEAGAGCAVGVVNVGVVVICPEVGRHGNATERLLGGNALLNNERTNVRDDCLCALLNDTTAV